MHSSSPGVASRSFSSRSSFEAEDDDDDDDDDAAAAAAVAHSTNRLPSSRRTITMGTLNLNRRASLAAFPTMMPMQCECKSDNDDGGNNDRWTDNSPAAAR